jgi:hypothetical protein
MLAAKRDLLLIGATGQASIDISLRLRILSQAMTPYSMRANVPLALLFHRISPNRD